MMSTESIIIALIAALVTILVAVVGMRYYHYWQSHHKHGAPGPMHCLANSDCGGAAACVKGTCVSIMPQVQAAQTAADTMDNMIGKIQPTANGEWLSKAATNMGLNLPSAIAMVSNIATAGSNVVNTAGDYQSSTPYTAYSNAMLSLTEDDSDVKIMAAVRLAPAAAAASGRLQASYSLLVEAIDTFVSYVQASAVAQGKPLDARTKQEIVALTVKQTAYLAMPGTIQKAAANMVSTAAVVAQALTAA
jgi:hypothetical protein